MPQDLPFIPEGEWKYEVIPGVKKQFNIVKGICERLKKVGCENIYLTSVPGSEEFWKNCGFTSTDLLDPDNGLHIWIRNI